MRRILFPILTNFLTIISAIVLPEEDLPRVEFPNNICYLPADLGYNSTLQFLEDCPIDSMKRFKTVPKPAHFIKRHGLHPVVCCPEPLPDDATCLPTDAWCNTYSVSYFFIT